MKKIFLISMLVIFISWSPDEAPITIRYHTFNKKVKFLSLSTYHKVTKGALDNFSTLYIKKINGNTTSVRVVLKFYSCNGDKEINSSFVLKTTHHTFNLEFCCLHSYWENRCRILEASADIPKNIQNSIRKTNSLQFIIESERGETILDATPEQLSLVKEVLSITNYDKIMAEQKIRDKKKKELESIVKPYGGRYETK